MLTLTVNPLENAVGLKLRIVRSSNMGWSQPAHWISLNTFVTAESEYFNYP